MMLAPNPVLDDEEQELLNAAPEECLRHAVKRGAFSPDQITADLLPHVAAVVRSIATGERIPAPSISEMMCEIEKAAEPARERKILFAYPSLQRLIELESLTLEEAYQAAHAIDRAIGRYLTGTRYAAP